MLEELGQLNQYLSKRKHKGKQDPNATASFNNQYSRTSKAHKVTVGTEELKTNEEVEFMSEFAKNQYGSGRSKNSPKITSREKEN